MRLWLISVALVLSLAVPVPAHAMSKDVRTVLVSGVYGLAAGTAVGVVAWPIAKTPRTIIIGSSVGLYMGLVVGVFHILNRHDPENPLNPRNPYSEWHEQKAREMDCPIESARACPQISRMEFRLVKF
jgi:hypothetical protein